MANLDSYRSRRRIRIVTQRSAFIVAFLFCLLTRWLLIWFGVVKREDPLNTLLLYHLHWFLLSAFLGGVIGACAGYFLFTRWLAKQSD